MSIRELIFDNNSTLFQTLDKLEITQLATDINSISNKLVYLDESIRTLANTVDSNYRQIQGEIQTSNSQILALTNEISNIKLNISAIQQDVTSATQTADAALTQVANVTADVALVNSKVTTLQSQVASLNTSVSTLNSSVSSLTTQVNMLSNQYVILTTSIDTLTAKVTQIDSSISTLTSRVTSLEANAARNQLLRRGNEYIFTYRVGSPGTTYYYRITYSGTGSINANVGYSATVLDSQAGTSTSRTVYLAAPFDTFSLNGRYNYPMIQGPCILSFTANNTTPTNGYITTL